MPENFANNYQVTLATNMTSGSATADVSGIIGVPAVPFRGIVSAEGSNTNEIVLVTARNGTTLTMTRAVEAVAGVQVASSHNIGATFTAIITAVGLISMSGIVDVRSYGVVMDGITDSTTALAAAFASLTTVAGLYFPPGTCLTSATLDIPYTQYRRIFGAGPGQSIISMTGSNKPIIRATFENTHTIEIVGLTLAYATNQSTAQTDSFGLQFKVTGGTAQGFYHWSVRNLQIIGAKIGIGIAGTGSVAVWGSLFDTIMFSTTSTTALLFASPTTVGMPCNTFRNIKIFNFNTGVINDSYAIVLSAIEATIEGLDIEGWYNSTFYITGSGTTVIRGVHIEHHVFNVAFPVLFYVADGPVTITGISVSGSATAALNTGVVFSTGNTAASLTVNDVLNGWTSATGLIAGFGGSGRAWSRGAIWNVTANPNVSEYLIAGYGVGGIYTRVDSEGLPPQVDVLPAASATYRGRRFRVLGGAGVDDVDFECSKNAADVYAWVAVGGHSQSATLGANVTLTAGASYFDGPSLVLGAGTWVLFATINISPAGADRVFVKMWDGTTVYCEGEVWQPTGTGETQIPLMARVVLSVATTVKISGRVAGGGVMNKSANSVGNSTATQLVAMRS